MSVQVPRKVREALAGSSEVGCWDPIFPLITVDENGFPHVCLLGRAELAAGDRHVYAVLSGSTTPANLRCTGRATLIVIAADSAIYCKLLAEGDPVVRDGLHGVRFRLATAIADGAQIELTPARYRVDERLIEDEQWDACARLLDRLGS